MIKGIDVSYHQGIIDWAKVKNAGIKFVMIKAGFGNSATQIDTQFKNNINGTIANNIPYGLYWFSYAHNEDEARKEANVFMQVIKGYKPQYPVCYDFEYEGYDYVKKTYGIKLDKNQISKNAVAFLAELEKNHYYCINYANKDYIDNYYNDTINKRYDLWYARPGIAKPDIDNYGIWQANFEGRIDGINTKVDINYTNKDYPTIMVANGLNGFKKIKQPTETKKETATVTITTGGKTYNGILTEQ